MSTQRRSLGVHSQPHPRGPNGERLCFNCRAPLPKGRRYNCSSACSEEWQCKTSPSYLRYVLKHRDKGVCAVCGCDTNALKAEFGEFCRSLKSSDDFTSATWTLDRERWLHEHGIPPSRSSSDWWDADHIVPVVEGGGECGLSNYWLSGFECV